MNSNESHGMSLADLAERSVVLDTAGYVVYIGILKQVGDDGFWIEDADVHDCRDGHASKEQYVLEARMHGVRVNRKRVFVPRGRVIRLSALDDVVVD